MDNSETVDFILSYLTSKVHLPKLRIFHWQHRMFFLVKVAEETQRFAKWTGYGLVCEVKYVRRVQGRDIGPDGDIQPVLVKGGQF